MKRIGAFFALLTLVGVQAGVRAQDVPGASVVRLEELLISIGRDFGIVIVTEDPLDESVIVGADSEPMQEILARTLMRHSYLLVYSGKWAGPIDASPNLLHIFSSGSGQSPRALNWSADASQESHSENAEIDAIAHIDDVIAAAGSGQDEIVAALAFELATSNESRVREEAVYALADMNTHPGFAAMAQGLADESPLVREAVVIAAADSSSARAQSLLQMALADTHARVRDAAFEALNISDWHREDSSPADSAR